MIQTHLRQDDDDWVKIGLVGCRGKSPICTTFEVDVPKRTPRKTWKEVVDKDMLHVE